MIVAVAAAFVGALVVIGGAPLLLSAGAWRFRFPRLALTAWLIAFLLGGAALLSSLILAIAAVLVSSHSASDWLPPIALTLFGWIGLAAVGAAGALATAQNEPFSAARRRSAQAMTLLAAARAYRWDDLRGVEICFVDADGVTAMAMRGDAPRIVVGRAFAEALSPAELRSVLEHERAHLSGWHDRIVRLAQLNRACFPILRGARSFDQTVRLLIELVADDVAARRCGAACCASALHASGAFGGGEASALRAMRLATPSRSRDRVTSRAARPAES